MARASEFDEQLTALLTRVQRSRDQVRDASAAPRRRRRAPAEEPEATAARTVRPSLAWSRNLVAGSAGLVTRGVGAGLRAIEATGRAAARCGPWGWSLFAAAVLTAGLSLAAWIRAPGAMPLIGLRLAEGTRVPALLQEQWLRDFPHLAALRHQPDGEVLAALADHLAAQPSVASVDSVRLVWAPRGDGPLRRQVEVALRLREPVLPIVLADGSRAWVDAEGVVMSSLLPGPSGQPVVRGYERGGRAALREILDVWPLLRERLPRGLVRDVHLAAPVDASGERGIVLRTRPGARIVWGRPGDERYGVSPERKVANLVHILPLHGNLRHVERIDVRFEQPFAVIGSRPAGDA